MAVAVIDEVRELVLLAQSGTVRCLRWADGQPEAWSPVLPSRVTDCALAADGTAATLHQDGTLRFWKGGPHPLAEYRDSRDHLGAVLGFPGQNCFLAVGRGGTQVRLDTKGRAERAMPGGDIERWGLPGPYVASTDGSTLVVGGGPGRVRSWDFDGSRAAPQARFVNSPPVGISPHPDGKRLIVYTHDGQTWLWTPGTQPVPLGEAPLSYYVRNGAMPGERNVIGGKVGLDAAAAIFDADRAVFRMPFLPSGGFAIVGAAVVPGDRILLAAGDTRFRPSQIRLCKAGGTGLGLEDALIDKWEVPMATGIVTCMDAAADGRRVAFGCVYGGLHVWELSSDGKELRPAFSVPTNGRVWSIDMSADGRFVVAGIEDGSVLKWAVGEGRPKNLVDPRGRPARCSLADNDQLVIEFAPDGLVRLLDTRQRPATVLLEVAVGDGAVVRDAVLMRTQPSAPVAGGDWDLESMQLATVTSDGWVRIWSLDAGKVVEAARKRLQVLESN